jgi:hypothetical protein
MERTGASRPFSFTGHRSRTAARGQVELPAHRLAFYHVEYTTGPSPARGGHSSVERPFSARCTTAVTRIAPPPIEDSGSSTPAGCPISG